MTGLSKCAATLSESRVRRHDGGQHTRHRHGACDNMRLAASKKKTGHKARPKSNSEVKADQSCLDNQL